MKFMHAGADPKGGSPAAPSPLLPVGKVKEGKSLKLVPPDVKFYG